MKILVVKMSSLGDLVHTLPAITDIAAARSPESLEIDWVVEENFAAIAELHPAVTRVMPVAWRRWRKNIWKSRRELGKFIRELRSRRYDLVIDAQGLIKSALVTRMARATDKAGYDFDSAREGLSSWFYRTKFRVDKKSHAIDRTRSLFSQAGNYSIDLRRARYGVQRRHNVGDYCLLLHGTTWTNKLWPIEMWSDLAGQMAETGTLVRIPWGNDQEKLAAQKIAERHDKIEALPALSLAELLTTLFQAKCAVGVDSGLAHAAAAFGVPLVVLYGPTAERKTGARGDYTKNLQSALACSPCLRRSCGYQGERLVWQGRVIKPPCFADITPDIVLEHLQHQITKETQRADRDLHI